MDISNKYMVEDINKKTSISLGLAITILAAFLIPILIAAYGYGQLTYKVEQVQRDVESVQVKVDDINTYIRNNQSLTHN